MVIEELKWDAIVDETDVGVEVGHGIVTLTGTLNSYAEKAAAREAAHRVVGVFDVANDIDVKVPGAAITDTEIAHAARHAFEWDALVPAAQIHTTVSHGYVTLEGTVPSFQHREEAECVVKRLKGVQGVHNRIRVSGSHGDPAEVRHAIEEALERQAIREAGRIQVTVEDGELTLSGMVRSWPEKRAIIGAAGHAPGITDVVDRIWIGPV